MIRNKFKQCGMSLLEITISTTLFMIMMGVTLTLILNIQDVAQMEIDRSHLQSQIQGVVDKIVNDIRESKWRWSYVANRVNGEIAPNSYFLYPTGRDEEGFFHFNTSGNPAEIGLTDWQGMSLLVAIPDPGANTNASGVVRFNLWKFTQFESSIIPLVGESASNGIETDENGQLDLDDDIVTANQHGDIFIEDNDTQIFVKDSNGITLMTINKSGQVEPNQTGQIIMKNVTRFYINAVDDADGNLVLPTDDEEKYRFPFSLDMEAFYVSTGVRVSLSTAVLAENKNNL